MHEFLPLLRELGSLVILAGLLWILFSRGIPKVVGAIERQTATVQDIARENREAHELITRTLERLLDRLEGGETRLQKHEQREEAIFGEIRDSIREMREKSRSGE